MNEEQDKTATEGRLVVLIQALLNMQVCAPKTWDRDRVEKEANAANPTGVSHRWKIAENEEAMRNPVQCAGKYDRYHWMLIC